MRVILLKLKLTNKLMKTLYTLIVTALALLLSSSSTMAQTVVMEQDVNQDTVISNFGKNKKYYFGSNMGFGAPIENATGSKRLEARSSYSFHYGVYYKIRLANFYSIVTQAAYQRPVYSFVVSDPNVYYEDLVLNNGSLALLNRINIGKRGDFIGYYLAFGASIDYTFKNKLKSKADVVDPDSPENTYEFYKLALHRLNYINKTNFNAEVQIGINKFVLYGKYRLTDIIQPKMGYNLPTTTVGVLFDFGA